MPGSTGSSSSGAFVRPASTALTTAPSSTTRLLEDALGGGPPDGRDEDARHDLTGGDVGVREDVVQREEGERQPEDQQQRAEHADVGDRLQVGERGADGHGRQHPDDQRPGDDGAVLQPVDEPALADDGGHEHQQHQHGSSDTNAL
jgi:hypothetical protein